VKCVEVRSPDQIDGQCFERLGKDVVHFRLMGLDPRTPDKGGEGVWPYRLVRRSVLRHRTLKVVTG